MGESSCQHSNMDLPLEAVMAVKLKREGTGASPSDVADAIIARLMMANNSFNILIGPLFEDCAEKREAVYAVHRYGGGGFEYASKKLQVRTGHAVFVA